MGNVKQSFVDDQLAATDAAMDQLEAVAKTLKQVSVQELKRCGFDLDRVAGDVAKWQRTFRRTVSEVNETPGDGPDIG